MPAQIDCENFLSEPHDIGDAVNVNGVFFNIFLQWLPHGIKPADKTFKSTHCQKDQSRLLSEGKVLPEDSFILKIRSVMGITLKRDKTGI